MDATPDQKFPKENKIEKPETIKEKSKSVSKIRRKPVLRRKQVDDELFQIASLISKCRDPRAR